MQKFYCQIVFSFKNYKLNINCTSRYVMDFGNFSFLSPHSDLQSCCQISFLKERKIFVGLSRYLKEFRIILPKIIHYNGKLHWKTCFEIKCGGKGKRAWILTFEADYHQFFVWEHSLSLSNLLPFCNFKVKSEGCFDFEILCPINCGM